MIKCASAAILMLAASVAAAQTPPPWTERAVEAPVPERPRILLIHDMEGLSGQDDPYSFLYGHPKYAQGQRALIADVNAVIAGLFDGGAQSVLVADGHGSGNPAADILIDQLDRRARMATRPTPFDTYRDLAEPDTFDAIAVVGMHAKSGSGGFASHTYTIGMQIFLNGQSITETELVGLFYGRVGVPVIFASGDDRLASDLRSMPWIQYVTTKKALSASQAQLYPVEQVHAAMRERAKLAVRRLARAKVMVPAQPLRTAVKAVPPANMRWLADMPGVEYQNETVSFTAKDILDAYRGIRPIVSALAFSFSDATQSAFNAQPDARMLKLQGTQELYRRWFEAESGRAVTPDGAAPPVAHEYHGFR